MAQKAITDWAAFLAIGAIFSIILALDKRDARRDRSLSEEQPVGNDRPETDSHEPPTDEHERVSVALHAYATDQKADQAKKAKHDRKIRRWTRAATIGAFIYTIITAFILVAAVYQAFITRESFTAVQRAFVYPVESPFIPKTGIPFVNGLWIFTPEWENSGTTPANSVRIQTHCESIDPPLVDDPETDPRAGHFKHIVGKRYIGIGPHQKTIGVSCEFSQQQLAMAVASKQFIYIVMRADYDDVFKESHVIEFCRAIQIVGDVSDISKPPSYATRVCETHNCTDDNCPKQASQ